MKKKFKKGMALISVLAISAVALLVISAGVMVSVINGQISISQISSQKAYQAAEALKEEAVLRFIRSRDCLPGYDNWAENCLQIQDTQCKMVCSLTEAGGTVDVWGRNNDAMRHLQIEISVLGDESVSVTAQKEIF